MIKNILLIFVVMAYALVAWGQDKFESGCYRYMTNTYMEQLLLKDDGSFIYNINDDNSVNIKVKGNWQFRNGEIILNSSPHKRKMFVRTDHNNGDNNIIQVRTKNNYPIVYNLFLIKQSGDTICHLNQYNRTILLEEFESFFISDMRGLYSPVHNNNSGFVEVFFETDRVIDNEHWVVAPKGIIPIGLSGKYVRYMLERVDK
jgi:hypothetical protein